MIQIVFFVFSAGMGGAALVLLYRMRKLNQAVARLSQVPRATDVLMEELTRLILRALDTSLLPEAGPMGLADIQISCREVQDPYRNLEELQGHLGKTINCRESGDLQQLIKGLFQVQSSLGIPFEQLNTCLTILEARLRASAGAGKVIARIEIVLPGVLLDSKKMMAINNGTHVKQPLGVVVIDVDGKVVNKAKVICG